MKEFKEFWNIEHFSNDCLEDIIKDYLNNKQMETSQDLENNEFSGIDRQEIKIKIDKEMFDCKNVVQDFVDSLNNANLPQKASVKDNDYFTPDIEDIRVGYECEICPHLGYDNTWIPTVGRCEQNSAKDCNQDELTYDCLIDGYVGIRTPYLTREQIEAEGWEDTTGWLDKDKKQYLAHIPNFTFKTETGSFRLYLIDLHVPSKGIVISLLAAVLFH